MGWEGAGVEPLLGTQEGRLGVDITASLAFHAVEHVLGPAVNHTVQEPLGRCGQGLSGEAKLPTVRWLEPGVAWGSQEAAAKKPTFPLKVSPPNQH